MSQKMSDELTVGSHVEIREKVVCQRLAKVGPVHLEGHEHDTGPGCDDQVRLADQGRLFSPCPSGKRIKAMYIFPVQHVVRELPKLRKREVVAANQLLCG
jgi:hypothetical protein